MIDQTLAVLLTPPGRGAVAVILVSGPDARHVVARMLESGDLPAPGRTRHVWLRDARGERMDDALLVAKAPQDALTGCSAVEVGIHGGPTVINAVMEALETAGARCGEWKHLLEQARQNRSVDPICMAAYRRLNRTVSRTGAAILARALSGELHERLRRALDLADRGEPGALRDLAKEGRAARARFRPLRVVLIGPPNAGKSTLFNSLLGWDRATVSGDPGTTRDAVEEDLLVDDFPVRLTDTAGGHVERPQACWEGGKADVVLYVVDGSVARPDEALPTGIDRNRLVIVVNKIDRLDAGALDRFSADWIKVSALEGVGRDTLFQAVFRVAGISNSAGPAGAVVFTRKDLRLLEMSLAAGARALAARAELRARV